MLVVAALSGVSVSHLFFAGSANVSGGVSGIVMVILDSWYRSRRPHSYVPAGERWWSARSGGFIAIMPSWAMGITLLAMAVTRPYWHYANVR